MVVIFGRVTYWLAGLFPGTRRTREGAFWNGRGGGVSRLIFRRGKAADSLKTAMKSLCVRPANHRTQSELDSARAPGVGNRRSAISCCDAARGHGLLSLI